MEVCWYTLVAAVYKNTSVYLFSSIVLAVASVLFVWLYEKHEIQQRLEPDDELTLDAGMELCGEGVGMRPLDTRALVEQISAEMTPEQRENERAVEQEQLAAIFKLLREQEDKFHMSSMDQVQEQLNLYR